ncbi:hypothetical protein WJX84_005184 [Apatococcus fuscideae]|uniref:Uncharacterized protein n=1 Tax=Apatococcus fuscideae TaxID=2026836 RepID=A0AAW1SSY7_9CHLO
MCQRGCWRGGEPPEMKAQGRPPGQPDPPASEGRGAPPAPSEEPASTVAARARGAPWFNCEGDKGGSGDQRPARGICYPAPSGSDKSDVFWCTAKDTEASRGYAIHVAAQ